MLLFSDVLFCSGILLSTTFVLGCVGSSGIGGVSGSTGAGSSLYECHGFPEV